MNRLLRNGLMISALAVLAGCGGEQPAATQPAAEAPPAPAPAAEPVAAAPAPGEDTFKKACVLCHKNGEGGAPKLGDKEAWAPRIAQGLPMLQEHAIAGFTGATGVMPSKGGSVSLSDDEVKAAVEYMVSQAQ